jgi:4a-hydroxytetrahydrobiopterin dehydratase
MLAKKECIPCRGGVPPLNPEEIARFLVELHSDWKVIDAHHLERSFCFQGFRPGLDFTNAVGELSEAQGHHPDIHLAWGSVRLTVWTHKINGLTESDFIFAAKVDHIS